LIEKIEINFSFGKLLKNLDKVLEENMMDRKEIFAQGMKENIQKKKFKPISKTTKRIREKGLSGHVKSNNFKTTSSKPLIHTSKLLKSIKPVQDGVSMLEYGKYHLEYQQIRPNKWTEAMKKRNIILDFAPVFERNFLPITKKGNFSGVIQKKMKMLDLKLHRNLSKNLRK
tara:strand:- start:494 stop:1006 length:513 start_codon:yes stop_codon:yes gene_type:complete